MNLALEMSDLGVVGIDLSGNPTVGEWYLITLSRVCCIEPVITTANISLHIWNLWQDYIFASIEIC